MGGSYHGEFSESSDMVVSPIE